MPTEGLSLVAFMDQPHAINHLRNACVPADSSDGALIAEWNAAKAKLGAPVVGAGHPDIQPIPASHQQYIVELLQQPWVQKASQQGAFQGGAFQLVEIDKLLAYQFTIDKARSLHHCGNPAGVPTLDELLTICLPQAAPTENIQVTPGPQSMLLRAHSLNVRTLAHGLFNTEFLGILFGPALPLTHVVQHNGRCYLHNGFHRAYGLRKLGVTHMPCLLRDVADHTEVGIRNDGATFSAPLLESNDPPTLAHFTQGRAYDVSLRKFSRVLHVSWAEYAAPDE